MNFGALKHLLIAIFSISLLTGCGGGSRGSGGQLYDGFVGDSDGRALSGVSVTILATGDSAVSDASGGFSIQTEPQSGAVEFLLEGPAFSGRVVSDDVPTNATRVFVQFAVGSGTNPSIGISIDIRERRPDPTPRPTRVPTAQPGVTVAPTNTPSPGVAAPTATVPSVQTPDDDGGGNDNDDIDDNEGGGGEDDENGDSSNGDSSGNGDGSPTRTPTPVPTASATRTPRNGDSVQAEGLISAISSNSVIIEGTIFSPTNATEYRGADGRAGALGDFKVGDSVKAKGRVTGGQILLERLELAR